MNKKAWIQGLLTAFITAFSTAAIGVLTLPTVFNGSKDGLFNIAKMTLVPALISVFTFLKQSPLPTDSTTTTVTVSKATTPGLLPCIALLVLMPLLFVVSGCSTWDRTTFQTLTADKALLGKAQSDYEARRIPKTACVQSLINDGKDAQTAGVESFKTYLVLKLAGADVTQQIDNISGEVADVALIISKIQSLATVPCTAKVSAVASLKTLDNAQYGTRRIAQ